MNEYIYGLLNTAQWATDIALFCDSLCHIVDFNEIEINNIHVFPTWSAQSPLGLAQ